MPNYCDNFLTIDGNHTTREEILMLMKSEDSAFDFEKILPMPDYIYRGGIGTKEKEIYGENNWYDWSVENWGTKWNSVDAEIHSNEIYFQTAWSPCDPVIAALAKKFPTMRFTYTFMETGMAFCGKRVYENGEIIFYYDGDYAENYDCENEECEYSLADTLFPLKESGFVEAVEKVERNNGVVRGNLHFREYINNRIFQMTDGAFVATEDYAKKFVDFQTINLANAA